MTEVLLVAYESRPDAVVLAKKAVSQLQSTEISVDLLVIGETFELPPFLNVQLLFLSGVTGPFCAPHG